jgi:hypothetical protein
MNASDDDSALFRAPSENRLKHEMIEHAGEVIAERETLQLDLGDSLGLPALPAGRAPSAGKNGGRPAGAVNRRTVVGADFLLRRYGNPIERLLQLATMGVDELASRLGVSKFEAWCEQRKCLVEAAPYLMSKQPTAIAVANVPGLVLGGMGAVIMGEAREVRE